MTGNYGPYTTFEAFRSRVEVVDTPQAVVLRERFVECFVNTAHPEFSPRILERQTFSDGEAYTGYLWDFLSACSPLPESSIWKEIPTALPIYVMWDIHSAERILIPEYWKYPKDAIVRGAGSVVRRGAAFLPEDIYLFDDSFSWAAALTHEDVDRHRYCLWVHHTSTAGNASPSRLIL